MSESDETLRQNVITHAEITSINHHRFPPLYSLVHDLDL